MIRIGFIGCGGIAREYLQRLDMLSDEAQVVAFCDIDQGRAQELALGREVGRDRQIGIYTDYRPMLYHGQLDAIFDNLPPFARGDELVLAAERGCAIFTTKPLALDLATAQRSFAAIEQAGVINSVGYMFRYSGITKYVKNLLQDRPLAMIMGQVIGAMPGGWNQQRALSGGQIVEQSTHMVDLARYFGGEIKQVYALGRKGTVPERVDYEDVTTVSLDFDGGAVGTIVSTCAVWKFFWGCTIIARDLHLELVYDAWTVRGTIDGEPVDYHDPVSGYLEQIATFVRAVRDHDQSLVRCSYRDGLGTLATTLAANRSLVSGLPEPVIK
ncbi:MAG: Gfo/Idh/MocA family oxidoreductase [Herpetosiphonaceae bacterium]|nr:Gfo/Idh/MocA family oxidoreductase [Herpetosiphonaceae bacterium]